jgi:hypothetical protein
LTEDGGNVPGLNTSKIEWETSRVRSVITIMLEKYRAISAGKATGDELDPFYAPYQFTLPILQTLYFLFEKEDRSVKKESILASVRDSKLRVRNPHSRRLALTTSLRAIAYLSWEPESRIFLVRRVFPTYFDFLSVSHIPEGWGVSSKMLESLQERLRDRTPVVVNGTFYETVNVKDRDNLPYVLPYLAEQERLEYKHVLVLPVFHPNRPGSDRDMLGTFLFFISDDDGVPQDGSPEQNRFRSFANNLCKATADLVRAHNRALAPTQLSKHWRAVRKDREGDARIAEVRLRCDGHNHKGDICKDLESAASQFLGALTIPNYYAIRDSAEERKQKNDAAVFLVTARHKVSLRDFKKRLLRIVTDELSDREIGCHVSIKAGEPATGGAFHLRADRKWHHTS